MKKILGLDLGSNSIGWAVVNEAENADEKSSIVKLGVRVNPLTTGEIKNFEEGKSITTNANRTLKRSARRNLQRYKLRRESLIQSLLENNFITSETKLSETGNHTTFETYRLRAKAVSEKISLEELARVLLMINKKRGYKSSRKAKSADEGQLIDGMGIAKELYENNWTPGQYVLNLIKQNKKYVPDFYRSDLQTEFKKVYDNQASYYPHILTNELYEELIGKNTKEAIWAICEKAFNAQGIELKGNKRSGSKTEIKEENYTWRVNALSEKLELEQFVIVLQEISKQLNSSSGYLGAISDRSKELYFNQQTVGQYLMAGLNKDPHFSLKNKVFYRQDYLDEYEKIWETQSKFHPELTQELKHEIGEKIIFYQRPLRSQKGLISFCEFENQQIEEIKNGKKRVYTIGLRVCPRSSLLFQEFKIWQILNNVVLLNTETKEKFALTLEEKEDLFNLLNHKKELSAQQVLKHLTNHPEHYNINFKKLEGNCTFASFRDAIKKIKENEENTSSVEEFLKENNYNGNILKFDSSLPGKELQKQDSYKLWHVLYSHTGSDNSNLGDETLVAKVQEITNFSNIHARTFVNAVNLISDYGSLSAKAIRKILPHLRDGLEYSLACEYAGYRHSKNSLTKEELENKVLKEKLENLPKNSLRNPVVEKILNQMVNVVNCAIDTYGKPDEIRIELARELKKSAAEREDATTQIAQATKEHEKIRGKIMNDFSFSYISRKDIIRYKLYMELKDNGFKTLYSNTYIPYEKLFSKEFDIEHIIPQSKLFDDSFSNKTLELRTVNLKKGNRTARDFIIEEYGNKGFDDYKQRLDNLLKLKAIKETKYKKLLMTEKEIPDGFIQRDLRDSQYIARKAKEMLSTIVKDVVSTSGQITDRLREDWNLIHVMQELNWDKYHKLGLTEEIQGRDGQIIRRIKDWTKRNDHRHHAMDALTIAFTKRSHIQYLNNLNARIPKAEDEHINLDNYDLSDIHPNDRSQVIYAIEKKELHRNSKGKLLFNPPMPIEEFRAEARKHLENILISIKSRNKVVTRNINKAKNSVTSTIINENGDKKIIKGQITKTPRGQLHEATIYGYRKQYATKEEKINANFTANKIAMVANPKIRQLLSERLAQYEGNPKKAFTGKNSLEKNPIWLNAAHTKKVNNKVKLVWLEPVYTIRKEISEKLKIEKVIDPHIRKILQLRLDEFGGDTQKAFTNLEENPIWLNKEKGIAIKRVTISDINNAISLHHKHDKNGKAIIDANGNQQPVDFVNTGNNHHVAIYRDANGNLQENVVSFFEATSRANRGLPIIDKTYKKNEGWEFLFTMKQNEYFVFPRYETTKDEDGKEKQIKVFDPKKIELLDPKNYAQISPNLFRVQNIANKDYTFRHHLETTVTSNLKDITYKRIRSPQALKKIVKVRVNHIGEIVAIGEY